jgi:hypothetical protein
VATTPCFLHGTTGASDTRHSLRPRCLRDSDFSPNNSRAMRGEKAEVCVVV